jgi:hypothetical protein
MEPGPEQGFLHDVFRPLPVAAGEPERVTQQRRRVLGVERADECLVTGPLARLAALSPAVMCHD